MNLAIALFQTLRNSLLTVLHFRKLAIFLCDWDLSEQALFERLSKLSADGERERAAAIALFANKLNWTIDILSGTNSDSKNSAKSQLGKLVLS